MSRDSGTINHEQREHGFADDGESFGEIKQQQEGTHIGPAIQMIGVSGLDTSLTAAWQNNYMQRELVSKNGKQLRASQCVVL